MIDAALSDPNPEQKLQIQVNSKLAQKKAIMVDYSPPEVDRIWLWVLRSPYTLYSMYLRGLDPEA